MSAGYSELTIATTVSVNGHLSLHVAQWNVPG